MKNDFICPRCGSKNINNKSFDFINFCKDCDYSWEV